MRPIILSIALLVLPASAFANQGINNLPALTQSQFRSFSADLAAVLVFKPLAGAAPEGITGFDVGVDFSTTNVAHQSEWNLVTGGGGVTAVPMAQVRVSKGLPLGFDAGGFYSYVPNSNIQAYGGALRYAILDGGALSPAVGIRAAYSRLSGVDQLAFDTKSLDIAASKGFGPFTPYAGVGRVWVYSDPGAATGLQNESFAKDETFVGLSMSLLVFNLAFEVDRIAGNNTYSLKLGFGV